MGGVVGVWGCRKPEQPGYATRAYLAHLKWHDADPGFPFESIQREGRGDQLAQYLRCHWPVRKKEVSPALAQHPLPPGQRYLAMSVFLQDGASIHNNTSPAFSVFFSTT